MIGRLQGLFKDALAANLDLLGLWLLAVVLWPLVPSGSWLASPTLDPWLVVTLCGALALRGARLGAGAHPMLTPRKHMLGALYRRVAVVLTPLVLLASAEAAGSAQSRPAILAGVGVASIATLLALGRRHGLTAWRPPCVRAALSWIFGSLALLLSAAWIGFAGRQVSGMGRAIASSALLGLVFLGAGLVEGRARHLAQRKAAGLRDGAPYRVDLFPFLLAALGPSVGLYLLHVLFRPLGGLDFNQAYVAALHVVVWVGLVWPRPTPLARTVLLHEVLPMSGEDQEIHDIASPFDAPPEGALRLDPRRMQRTRVIHCWMVPVRGSRIADLDDPVRPLWEPGLPPLPSHSLGDAAFEPDPVTRATQADLVTLRMRGGDEAVSLTQGEGLTRRIAILRPFLPVGVSSRRRIATYAWDQMLPKESVQLIDHTTTVATLRDGDVIVVSVEGVAHAWEIELGAVIFSAAEAEVFRPPQLADYVRSA